MNTIKIGNNTIYIKQEWKTGVAAVWILGLLAHAYRFFNFLPTWDSMFNFKGVGQTHSLGRIFLGFFGRLSSEYDLPWVNGALSLIYISIAVILLIELFQLKSRMASVLLAGLIVSFPTVTSAFAYMFTADPYMAAFFMSVLAVYLTKKYKYGLLLGMVSLGLSIGIYQAYICVSLVLILMLVIQALLLERKTCKETVLGNWKQLPMLLGGFVFYKIAMFLIFTYYETVYGYDMTTGAYQGIDSMGIMTLAQYKEGIRKTLVNWAHMWCLQNGIRGTNKYGLIHLVLMGGIVLGTVLLIVKHRMWKKNVWGIVLTAAALCAMPFAAFAINLASPHVGYHTLMEMGVCFFYILLLLYLEKGKWEKKEEKILKGFGIFVLAVICYLNTLNANYAYFQMNLSYEKSYSVCSDILQKIEELDEYPAVTRVAIMGDYHAKSGDLEDLAPAIMGVSQDVFLTGDYHYVSMWNHVFGREFGTVEWEEKEAIRETEEYRNMPLYPAKGSVAVIEGIIVVRMAE
ncbi:MAG: glucosyltransferase domain-containing protein [Clostridiales bacterium]|nr:glucosyltransferase domain-containing protein [Clostridiales bacterium]